MNVGNSLSILILRVAVDGAVTASSRALGYLEETTTRFVFKLKERHGAAFGFEGSKLTRVRRRSRALL